MGSFTAEEKLARDVTRKAASDLYGTVPGNVLSGNIRYFELMNRAMILIILEDEDTNDFLTDAEQDTLEGKLIINS